MNAEERRVDRGAAITVAREILKDPKWFIINEHAREIAEMSKTLECDARGIPYKGRASETFLFHTRAGDGAVVAGVGL